MTRQQGFTFVELVVTLIVLSIAVSYAIPAYRSLSADSALRSTNMNLIAAINEARGLSLSKRVDVTLSATDAASWSNGWTLTDGTDTRSWLVGSTKNTVTTDDPAIKSITFQANGFISTTAVIFTICDDRTGEKGRTLTLQKNGKVDNGTATCS